MLGWLWVAGCGLGGSPDADDDGVSVEEGDCDDLDSAIAPGADETCDGADQDCNGAVDDDPVDGETYFVDDDGDGYGTSDRSVVACARPDGYDDDDTDCDDDDERVNPGADDTSDRDRNCDGEIDGGQPTAGEFFDGPTTIQGVDVNCDAGGVLFVMDTEGWASGGKVFSQETSFGGTQWSDEHDLESTEYDPNGAWDHLERRLADGASLNDWQRNVSTLFSSAVHFEPSGVMTYAFVVYDVDGGFADCLATGDDVTGMINGNHDRVNEPSFSLGSCQAGVSAF